jgi:hypothetical protein
MAKAKAKKVEGAVEVRLLQDSHLGKCNTVVEVSAADVAGLKENGYCDDDADAVEYARSLES